MATASTCQQAIDQLLTLTDGTAQRETLRASGPLWQTNACADRLAASLKQQADYFLRKDIRRSQTMVQLLEDLADCTHNPLYQALSLRAAGNIEGIGHGHFQGAIVCYDQAAAIYHHQHRYLEEAQTQVGKIGCLARLSRYEEAVRLGNWAGEILREHEAWEMLVGLATNMAVIHRRLGEGQQALAWLEEAAGICQQTAVERDLPGIILNRANVLRSLGQLRAAVHTGQQALQHFSDRGQVIGVARAQQSLATTYIFLGRFNEALALFDEVYQVYVADQRHDDAIVVQLFISNCLLQLGRFRQVLDSCRRIRTLFSAQGTPHEAAKALLNEAVAYAGLGESEQALHSIDEAQALFAAEGNAVWSALCEVEKAAILGRQGELETSLAAAERAATVFQDHRLPIRQAQAQLVAARAACGLAQADRAGALVAAVRSVAHDEDIPWLLHQCHVISGALAQQAGDLPGALLAFDRALAQLERLRGQLMVEFRADFLEDKQRAYEDAVVVCLDSHEPEKALHYVERAKSRALQELLAYQVDLRIRPRTAADRPIVAELQRLRAKRNQLVRGWTETTSEESFSPPALRRQVLQIEGEITQLWHTLLIRNADYARDAALGQVRTEPVQPYLTPQTLLIEYFVAHGELVVFLVTAQTVTVHRFPDTLRKLAAPARLLQLVLKAVPNSAPGEIDRLLANAQAQLQRLYQLLLEPIATALTGYERLIIIPHGPVLHYLPFHALYDGQAYLIERHEISYLPSASLLRFTVGSGAREATDAVAAFGFSCHGRLPFAVKEAQQVAEIMTGASYIEEAATLERLQESGHARVLHLATHGEFNRENPLFSGLTLANGQLATLDIFHLQLRASLVTLSACRTGHSVVKGGDELLGLMRAFLYAGAASLLLSQWPLYDQATMHWMHRFYQQLAAGAAKGAAVRHAMRQFIAGADAPASYRHPYFWAPFFLVGDTGPL